VSRCQKGKTNQNFTEARDTEWQWHQLGHMQVCTSLQTDNHASTPPLSFFTGQMPFLPPSQQRQSTEGISSTSGQQILTQGHIAPASVSPMTSESTEKPHLCHSVQTSQQHRAAVGICCLHSVI